MGWEAVNENAVEKQRGEYRVFVSSFKGSFNEISELVNFQLFIIIFW